MHLAVLDYYTLLCRLAEFLPVLIEVHVWNHQREDLFAGPHWLGLQNGWWWQLTLEIEPHQQIHRLIEFEKGVFFGEERDTKESVLHETHHRLVVFWCDNLERHSHDLLHLGPRLVALRNVHVHLVAVEVGVVGCRYAEVESESLEGQHLDSVAHQRHLVKRGLPVEYDIVIVPQLPLHDVARIQLSISSVLCVGQVNLPAIVTDDVLCSRPFGGAIAHELLHHSHVLAGDVLGDGQIHGN